MRKAQCIVEYSKQQISLQLLEPTVDVTDFHDAHCHDAHAYVWKICFDFFSPIQAFSPPPFTISLESHGE